MAMRRKGGRRQLRKSRTAELVEESLAVERFHLGRVGLDDIEADSTRTSFGHRALHHALARSPPDLRSDAIGPLERRRQRTGILRVQRGIEDDDAFALRARDKPLLPIRRVEHVNRAVR